MKQLSYEEMRPMVLAFLKEVPEGESRQLVNLVSAVEAKARALGCYKAPPSMQMGVTVSDPPMPAEDKDIVRQIVWDLVFSGVIIPGHDEHQSEVHFLKVSKYGREVLSGPQITPYDPDGYLADLNTSLPTLDDVIQTYLVESLQTFNRGNLLASAVMLGVASERAILLLIHSYVTALSSLTRQAAVRAKFDATRSINSKFDTLVRQFASIKPQLEVVTGESLDTSLNGAFDLIRTTRNDAGHPRKVTLTRAQVNAELQVFPHYCKTAYKLMGYFSTNTIA